MYERSAIVLERYFDNLLNYRRECNLRDNYNNYCELVEKLEKYQINYQKEVAATKEYNTSLERIKQIQLAQKGLYKKSAKLEYDRNLLFNNLDGKIEDIRKCIEKIEEDVQENNASMQETKENLLSALEDYNEKRFELSKCKRYKKMAENDYNELYEISKNNYDGITAENIAEAKAFAKFDDESDIIETLAQNGKDEKIPFNEEVIECATKFGIEIAKKEAASYLVIYDKMTKLLSDIDDGTAKINLHKKYVRNEKAKIDFILSVKEYQVQFLDYERMTVIHGRKSHNRLMSEACENFNTDIAQIDNLYTLLSKEIANKSTKKAYKELYNKSYLIDIEENDEKFKKEKNKINLSTATIMNTNYWRIEGIKNIYTVFYKDVVEVFGKTLDEFEVPKDPDELENEESLFESSIEKEEAIAEKVIPEEKAVVIEQVSEDAPALPGMAEAIEESEKETAKKTKSKEKSSKKKEDKIQVVEEVEIEEKETAIQEIEIEPEVAQKKKKAKKVKRYTRKKEPKENIINAVIEKAKVPIIEEQFNEEPSALESVIEDTSYNDVFDEIETEPDIFGEKYRDIEKQIAELDNLDDIDEMVNAKVEALKANSIKKADKKEHIQEIELDNLDELGEDMPYEDEDIPYEEESIFENIDNEEYENLNLKKIETKKSKKTSKKTTKQKKNGLLKNIMKLNAKDNKKVTAN